jgi:hypothetical protein
MNPLDELGFDSSTFSRLADTPGARHWSTPGGDPLAVHHCPFPPTLEGSPASRDRLRDYYRKLAEPRAGLVEVETPVVDRNVIAVRTILKAAQLPAGRVYVATLTLPFRNFSYVLEVTCEERGWTGMRDATILDRLLKSGEVTVDDVTGELRGWADDPYDFLCRAPLVRNRSERAEYDAHFADHPLSRARRTLALLEHTLQLSSRVRCAPRPHAYALAAAVPECW